MTKEDLYELYKSIRERLPEQMPDESAVGNSDVAKLFTIGILLNNQELFTVAEEMFKLKDYENIEQFIDEYKVEFKTEDGKVTYKIPFMT